MANSTISQDQNSNSNKPQCYGQTTDNPGTSDTIRKPGPELGSNENPDGQGNRPPYAMMKIASEYMDTGPCQGHNRQNKL